MSIFCSATIVLFFGLANCQQQYGPPGYTPGIPIGGAGPTGELLKPQESGYESSRPNSPSVSYGVPSLPSSGYSSVSSTGGYSEGSRPNTPSSSYGVPGSSSGGGGYSSSHRPNTPPPAYGAPGSRFRVVPADDFTLPEQHSNLIRYIVLKEFRVGPNGSYTPVQGDSGEGRTSGGGGGGYPFAGGSTGSGEVEIMKVEIPNSGEQSQINAVTSRPISITTPDPKDDLDGDEGAGEESDNSIEDNLDDGGQDGNQNDDYNNDDYNDDNVDNNSVDNGQLINSRQGGSGGLMVNIENGMQVFPARGFPINPGRRPSRPQSAEAETQAFMFSDPGSMETAGSRRQAVSTELVSPDIGTVVRNQITNTRTRSRNRSQARRNRNRNRLNRLRNNNNNNNNLNNNNFNAINNEVQVNKINAATTTQNAIPIVSLGSTLSNNSSSSVPPLDKLQDALGLISRYFSAQAELMRQSQNGQEQSNLITAPSSSVSVSTGGYSSGGGSSSGGGGYQASGQPESGGQAVTVDSGSMEPCFHSGTCGDSGEAPAAATQATFPASTYGPPPGSPGFTGNAAPENPRPNPFGKIAQTVAGGVKQVAGFKSALLNQVVNGFTSSLRSQQEAANKPSTGESGGYGPPAPSGVTSGSPIGLLRGIGGGIVNTVRNKGRAAVGIVGTKGQLVVKQVGTTGQLVTKGVSQTFNNKHEAFQSVIKHIQSIFASNPALLNSANW